MTNTSRTKKKPEKSLLLRIKKTGGRNNRGHITAWQRGGGARKLWRRVSFGQERLGQKARILALEYDPNRNALLALGEYQDGSKGYLLAPHGGRVGDEILCDEKTEVRPGNRMKLKHIPVGEQVYNVELVPGQGGKIVRAAGTFARVAGQEGRYTQLMFPSNEVRRVLSECFASVGMVSNPEFMYRKLRKAGQVRHRGRRPNVKGSAMNPVDHPHGGGEGRTPRGLKYPKTPWGKHALGVKTRKKRKWTNVFIVERRKKKT